MNACHYRCLLQLFLSMLAFAALGIYCIHNGIVNVSDISKRLLPISKTSFQKPVYFNTSIGLFSNKNQSCSCKGYTLAFQNVPPNELEDLRRRRSEEYRQYRVRRQADVEPFVLAASNSPLQYPIHGFILAPLQKSIIPGLALHAQERKRYEVSLSVINGVLSVEDVMKGAHVDGEGQSVLTISSTSLKQMNNLLSRVTYTSTVYRVKAKDMVHFSFEDHEAIFPIKITRPSVPFLFDPGNDISSQVTITTKTFLRYRELHVLINSIRKFYPEIKIIIADDSLTPEKVSGENIEHYIMPPGQGWFAGRNLALSQVDTKYFLWVDDDYVFRNSTKIENFVEIMEKIPELDVVGGSVGSNQFYFHLTYEEGQAEEGGCLRRTHKLIHQSVPGFDGCYFVDGVVNYFLARTEAVRRVGFDPFLKRVAHTEFFIDGLGQLLIASCKGLSVGHQPKKRQPKYRQFRFPGKLDARRKVGHHFFKNHLKCIKY
nr:beta-1,4 N-acetylgalactosaminyltransferase 1-like isoform X1 [Misgurnus anguillicaudatus]XP_055050489.1 beta-1,4 N-acetylgalactosaminyltransferase 1-like isoform X1 [Misgurnus anguillicaudatus]XP_055050490.1 beta-1,4 N-acetylgalactosaminyltransferase 1-like isoform X1 [Misgurnus anguillicaudatus]